jgi:hypothetical protein
MVNPEIVQALILVGMGIIVAIVLIFFGFALGRKTQGETTLPVGLFSPDEKPLEEDLFEKALLSAEEGGYTDEELDEMARARPYEGMQ